MEKIADKVARMLVREKVISDSMLEIYQYGLVRMFEIGAAVLTSLAVGMCVGMLKQTLLFFLFFIPLRSYLGGFHLRKYRDCYLMSCLTLAAVLAVTRFASFDMHVSCGLIVVSSVGIGLEAGLARKKQESGIYALVVWAVLVILLALTAVCYLRREQQTLVLLCCVTVIVLVSKRAERIS